MKLEEIEQSWIKAAPTPAGVIRVSLQHFEKLLAVAKAADYVLNNGLTYSAGDFLKKALEDLERE